MGRRPTQPLRLNELARQQARLLARAEGAQADAFRLAPTIPPSTSLIVRPGRISFDFYYWMGPFACRVWRDAMTLDLTDSSALGANLTFGPPSTFLGAIIGFNTDWLAGYDLPQQWRTLTTSSHQAAAEAEADLDAILNGAVPTRTDDWLYLWALVLAYGPDGRLTPVDPINRGRSYIFRDLRRWNRIV